MTTTPNPTAEQIVEHALREADMPWLAETPGDIVAALRAAGLLGGDLAEDQRERAARALYDTEPIRYTLSIHHEKVGESKPWDELNEATKGVYRRRVIKVLAAAGVAPQEPSAHVNPLATSGERVKNQADSSQVAPREPSCGNAQCVGECGEHGIDLAPQEPSECEHEAWEETGGSRRCSGCKEWLAPQEPNECSECHRAEGHRMDCAWRTAPSPDREKLIANAEDWLRNGSPLGPRRIIRFLLDALAGQPVLDESKVAEAIWKRATQKTSRGFFISNRDGAQKIARALCEAAKRGELT